MKDVSVSPKGQFSQVCFLSVMVLIHLFVARQLKQDAQVILAALPVIALVFSLFATKQAPLDFFVKAIVWIAITIASYALTLAIVMRVWPAVSPDGHVVMPIGQLAVGIFVGSLIGLFAGNSYFRLLRTSVKAERFVFLTWSLATFANNFVRR